MKLFKRFRKLKLQPTPKKNQTSTSKWNLDAPLVYLSPHQEDCITLRDLCSGTSIMGGTGAGKTSSSGRILARAFLRKGLGGLILCAKPDEWRDVWQPLIEEAGRMGDVIRIAPDEPWRFNFLDYELNRGEGGGQTENLVALFTKVTEIFEGKQGSGGGDGRFWERASRELLRNAIDLLSLAQGTLTLEDIVRVINEAPTKPEHLRDDEQGRTWRENSYCCQCLALALDKDKNPRQQHDFEMVRDYWLKRHFNLAERTRTSIEATFTSVADTLLHGMAWELFCTETNIVPELTFQNNKIIILDIPIQTWEEIGRATQCIFKYIWQRAVLRRDVNQYPNVNFLWADEAQFFLLSDSDFQFQTVARSARVCTVYLSQSFSNYLNILGHESEAHSLLGNLNLKIFHQNTDPKTNAYASEIISTEWTHTRSLSGGGNGQGANHSMSANESVQSKVLPSVFSALRTGGPKNHLQVEAIVFQGGRTWAANGESYLPTVFFQDPKA